MTQTPSSSGGERKREGEGKEEREEREKEKEREEKERKEREEKKDLEKENNKSVEVKAATAADRVSSSSDVVISQSLLVEVCVQMDVPLLKDKWVLTDPPTSTS